MENQNRSLLKRENRWGWTVLSIVICLLLSPLAALAAFVPQIVTMVPVLLMLLLGYVGPVSAAACTAIMVAISSVLLGGSLDVLS